MEKPKLRINFFVSGLMIAVALIYDGLQALIELITLGFLGWLINPIIDLWAFLTFFTWFTLQGASFARPSKALTLGATSIIEIIPFFNDLPTWTAGVIIMIAQTYAEDVLASVSPGTAQALGKVLNKGKGEKTAPEAEKPTDTKALDPSPRPQQTMGNIVNFPPANNRDDQEQQRAA
ncbi:MAG: hypothetical protein WC640_00670 [Candidatus Paceibacterota bacterium]|jgi:hypothetical protein